MENKIKMVVFDMAGTTVNENNLVYKSIPPSNFKPQIRTL